jgi:putative Ca2+/H+ antiporter (TMEM165/GDT1 family)
MAFSTFFSSTGLVAASEMGDKTQLLALTLATRFKKPWPILAGILVATVFNHALAATAGVWVAERVSPTALAVTLGLTFIGFGVWALKPDEEDEEKKESRFGPFLTTTILFFLAEMGDKTQLATVALGARFQDAWVVTAGTTLGMMISDGLAVGVGDRLSDRISLTWARRFAAVLFFAFGIQKLISIWS